MCLDLNPLGGQEFDPARYEPGVIAMWSGWALGDEVGVATWGPGAWAALGDWCDSQAPRLAALGKEVWLRPHAAHVLSDAQRCLTFLRGREGQPFGVLLDPVSMLAPSMLAHAPDHLRRILEALGPLPGVRAMMLPGSASEEGPRGVLAALAPELWPAGKPLVVSGGDGASRETPAEAP